MTPGAEARSEAVEADQAASGRSEVLARLQSWWAKPDSRALIYLLGLLALVAYFKLTYTAHTYTSNIDGGYYTNIARHVRDGHGLRTDVSLYHKAYAFFPHPTSVYPAWPWLYGMLAKVFPLQEVGRWAPTAFYFGALVAAYAWARRSWPESLLARFPGFSAGHVAVMLMAVNLNFFRFTSFPYTEGLTYLVLFAALWRFHALWRRPGLRHGCEIGLWLGLLMLCRSQMLIVAIAVACTLAFSLVLSPDRRATVLMLAGSISVFALILGCYLAWVGSFIPDAGLATLLRFDQARPHELLEPVDAVKPAASLGSFLVDRASGIPVAFGYQHKYAYQRTFHGFQYAVPLALPFLVASLIDGLRRQPIGKTVRELAAPESLNMVFVVMLALGGLVSIHMVHKIAWSEWNFAKRQALTCSFAFLLCLMYLLRHRRSLPVVLGVFLFCGSSFRGIEEISAKTAELEKRSKHKWGYKTKLIDWLHDRRGDDGQLVVASPAGITQRLSVHSEGVGYHWINQQTSLAELVTLVEQRDVEYVLLPTKPRAKWRVLENGRAFEAAFEQVENGVSGLRIYRPK